MAIIIDQEQKLLTPHTITLHTKNTTYQMAVGAYGQLLHLYYGPRLDGDMRYLLTYYDRGFSGNPYAIRPSILKNLQVLCLIL